MKSLLRIERVAVIRWSTLAFVAVLLFPLFFLRYGNTGAVVQSAMVMALPVTAAGLVFSNARVPSPDASSASICCWSASSAQYVSC